MAENSTIFAKGGGLVLRALLSEYDQCALHLWAEKLVEEETAPLREALTKEPTTQEVQCACLAYGGQSFSGPMKEALECFLSTRVLGSDSAPAPEAPDD